MSTKILYSAWMQEIDKAAIEDIGIPSIVLMENASRGSAFVFSKEFPLSKFKHVLIIVGKGNNGGDGLAIGRILHQKGYKVCFLLLSDPKTLKSDAAVNFKIIKNLGIDCSVLESKKDFWAVLAKYPKAETFIVDAVFGTGLDKPIADGLIADVIQGINQSLCPVAAVDIPSGLSDKFTPTAEKCVKATITATFQCMKTAHICPDNHCYCGEIKLIDIGIPTELLENKKYCIHWIIPEKLEFVSKIRSVYAHKGNFGHVLTVCGSPGKSGAGILSSMAVLRAGAGLCTAAVNAGNMISPVTLQPELMTFSYVSLPEVLEKINKGLYNCLLVGPGLSNSKETADFVEKIAAMIDFPLILDADALNAIAPAIDKTFSQKKCPVVLTPHPKEFSRLSGLSIARINSDRFQAAQMFAQQKQVFLVLKGHFTVIATPTGDVFVNPSGNPGMATAGSGDVLSGIIAGFIAQFYPKFSLSEILCAAVFLHGYAADLAVSEKTQICLLAGDIIQALPDAIKQFNDYDHPFLFS